MTGLAAIREPAARQRIMFAPCQSESEALSVDIDSAMRRDYPASERWDYGICFGHTVKKIVFIELHKAESGEVGKVLAKQRWLKDLLVGAIHGPHRWYWMPTGKISILPQSRYIRSLQSAGIQLVRDQVILD